jgi:hypothetical protein
MAAMLLLASCSRQPAETTSAKTVFPTRITQFYAAPGIIAKGSKTLLCYGVEFAREVRIEPFVEDIKPSLARCIEVRPKATTNYTLYARGDTGGELKQQTTVRIDRSMIPRADSPAPSMIQFLASQTTIAKGAPVTICYGVKDAASVSITPNVRQLEPVDRACFSMTLDTTTEFLLTERNAAGQSESEKLTITIQEHSPHLAPE